MNNQIKEEGLTDAYLLGKYDGIKQGRAEAIDECKTILKIQHMIRSTEDDFCAKVEIPFYRKLWERMEQLKEQKND